MNHPDCQYATLSGAVQDLEKQGYTDELTLTEEGLFNCALSLDPSKFTIDSFHRIEGPSDPADEGIVYAISSADLGLKGLLIGDYGPNAQDFIHKMVRKLPAHEHEGRVQPVQPIPHGESTKA
ncbi:MAG: phosphoribosylpyrophosphate synthetase [Flavobacteriales bacterium]